MAHLLTILVVEAIGKVYGVVKEGGLRGSGGDNGDLNRSVCAVPTLSITSHGVSIK